MDSWVPEIGVLLDHALGAVTDLDSHQTVNAYADCEGWSWPLLKKVLPPYVCSKIAGLRHPVDGAEDFPIWAHSADGLFSIQSAHDLLFFANNHDAPEALFNAIWKVRTPPRINTFLWKVV